MGQMSCCDSTSSMDSRGCSCSLEGRQLPKAESVTLTGCELEFEFEVQEITPLKLPEEPREIASPSPVWQDFCGLLKDQEFVAFPAFPNPPPAL